MAKGNHNDINVLFLGGVFAQENEAEVIAHSKKGVEFSANQMQTKLINAFRRSTETEVISAPFIGSYPNQSDVLWFHSFIAPQSSYQYVPFCNLWGFRNISRSHSLKKALCSFIDCSNPTKLIVVYSVHDPFLAAAAYAKKKDPSIKICLVAPDLPQYMNLEAKQSIFYKLFKRIDICSIQHHLKSIDSAVVLTKAMAPVLKVENIPYIVQEGIISDISLTLSNIRTEYSKNDLINIVYTGKLYEKFGVKNLIDAFLTMKESNYRLILCGDGDSASYVREKAHSDKRICYMGQVSPSKARELMSEASVLVNPRANNEVYTRYSFPSKTIEYLSTGKSVVAYMLDGMPADYSEFIFEIDKFEDPVVALSACIERAVHSSEIERSRKYNAFLQYARTHLLATAVVEKILKLNGVGFYLA